MHKNGLELAVWIVIMFAVSLVCTRDNPFSNSELAGVYVKSGNLNHGETLSVFSSDTHRILFQVKEMLDSVKYVCENNRFWPDGDTCFAQKDFNNDPVDIIISPYDTGSIWVSRICYKSDGGVSNDSFHIYSEMTIGQSDLSFSEGDSVLLYGGSVRDRDVTYNWSFGAAAKYTSLVCSLRVAVRSVLFKGDGLFWIEDSRFSSPLDTFDFSIRDTVSPDIICVNTNNVGNDTILTQDSIFNLQVRITDNSGSIDSAVIEGESFDYSSQDIYYKLLTGLENHPVSDPLNLVVYAMDNFTFGNESVEVFTIVFTDSATSLSPVEIDVYQPAESPYIVTSDSAYVSGGVINNSMNPFGVVVEFEIHDSVMSDTLMAEDEVWEWRTWLDTNVNFSRLRAYDLDGNLLDSTNLSIIYQPEAEDTMAPRIMSLEIGGDEAGGYYTTRSREVLECRIYEDGSGVQTVYVNLDDITDNSSGSRYYDTLDLEHLVSGNEVRVSVYDSAGNMADSTVVVFRNTLPLVTWPEPGYIAVDSLYTDTIIWGDQDGDTVRFSLDSGPEEFSAGSTGLVSWIPSHDDAGKNKIRLRAWDGYQPVYNTYTLYVTESGEPPPDPVEFKTNANDFPEYLEAGKDTLRVEFNIKQGTGIPPFRYSVNLETKDSLIIENSTDSLFTWVPELSDTGYSEFSVSVIDEFPSVDMFYAVVPIVEPNRPFSILLDYSSDTLPDGAIDINSRQDKDTLLFRIADPDSIITERYHVKILQTSTNTLSEIDSAAVDSFQYVLDPSPLNGYDTLVVTARDKDFNRDTLRAVVYFGLPPQEPQPLSPSEGETGLDPDNVVLKWDCTDPDSDSLTYEVFFGMSENTMVSYGEMAQDSLSISGLNPNTEYYWSVTASDWKGSSEGANWSFRTGF